MALTYRELIENLKALPDARLDDTVTVFVRGPDEFYSLAEDLPFVVVDRTVPDESVYGGRESVLDEGHAYLVI